MKKIAIFLMCFSFLSVPKGQASEGKHYSIGNGGEYQTSFGSGEYDEDIPTYFDMLLDSPQTKALKKLRKSIKDNIDYVFTEIIPSQEKSEWRQTRKDVNKEVTLAEGVWAPVRSITETLSIKYEDLANNQNSRYKSLIEFVEYYRREMMADQKYKSSFTVIEQNKDSFLIEIEQFEKGASDQIKKNTQNRRIEKWSASGEWLVGLVYSNSLGGDQEKIAAWPDLKTTWMNRFSKLNFSNNN